MGVFLPESSHWVTHDATLLLLTFTRIHSFAGMVGIAVTFVRRICDLFHVLCIRASSRVAHHGQRHCPRRPRYGISVLSPPAIVIFGDQEAIFATDALRFGVGWVRVFVPIGWAMATGLL